MMLGQSDTKVKFFMHECPWDFVSNLTWELLSFMKCRVLANLALWPPTLMHEDIYPVSTLGFLYTH